MTDKELLELAAKAIGIEIDWQYPVDSTMLLLNPDTDMPEICFSPRTIDGSGFYASWNPLTDDGDALRLAVKLGMGISIPLANKRTDVVTFSHALINAVVAHEGDPYAATRRAITRAAAELGKMKGEKHD